MITNFHTLMNTIAACLLVNTTIAFADALWRPSSNSAFLSLSHSPCSSSRRRIIQPALSSSQQQLRGEKLKSNNLPSGKNDCDGDDDGDGSRRQFVIQQIALDDTDELERMSRFCIDAFYGHGEDGEEGSLLSRKWKDIRLGAMRKAQLLDISLSTADNRCIFVAKAVAADNNSDEIIGCCEVIEDKLDIVQSLSPSPIIISERERRKNARPRPVIENLCVKPEYRRSGVGIALTRACEAAVQRTWSSGQDQIFAQVAHDNFRAFDLFRKCGYQFLFADPTCTEVVLDDALFAKEVVVTKRMLTKFLY